jgi:hypothetical protein
LDHGEPTAVAALPAAAAGAVAWSIRAFVRLEWHRFATGVSWFEAKMRIIRDVVRADLARPTITLPRPATA